MSSLLRECRKEVRLSQRDMAKLVGVDFSYISKLENGRTLSPPSAAVIRKLAKYAHVDESQLSYSLGRVPDGDRVILIKLAKRYGAGLTEKLKELLEVDDEQH